MLKVINIIPYPPGYDFEGIPAPRVRWDVDENTYVGIWDEEWAVQIGQEILKLTDEISYEVWQPDTRAKKIYHYTFSDGLSHRLFPATMKKRRGLKGSFYLESNGIYNTLLKENSKQDVILHLNGLDSEINHRILSLNLKIPVIIQLLGEINFSATTLFKLRKNPIGLYYTWRDFLKMRRCLNRVDGISYCNQKTSTSLKRYSTKNLYFLPVGIDFNFWQPLMPKRDAKKNLGLDPDNFVMLSASRLIPIKMFDRVIEILNNMKDQFKFQYLITGAGEPEYKKYLISIGRELIALNKLKFLGYLPDETLRTYYNAADLYLSPSQTEGMPVAVLKAFAMETPVLCTITGLMAEILLKKKQGLVAQLNRWQEILKIVFSGLKIETLNREELFPCFHWQNLIVKYLEVYKELAKKGV